QARGRGVRRLQQDLRRACAQDGVPAHGHRAQGAATVPRPYGGADSRHAGALMRGPIFLRSDFMKQSTSPHVAIIMDGNGRWATRRALPRAAGHRAGAVAVRRIVEAAPRLGIGELTLFAFSSDNWRRPPAEVGALMR